MSIRRAAMKSVPVKVEIPVNVFAVLSVLEGAVKKQRDKLKKVILPECNPLKPINADGWSLSYSSSPVEGLDTDKIRAEMSPEWLKKYNKPSTRETIKCASTTGVDASIKNVEFTDELCNEIVDVIRKHAKRQQKSKAG